MRQLLFLVLLFLFGLYLLARLYYLIDVALQLIIFDAVVGQVHKLEQAYALLGVFLEHGADHLLRHVCYGHFGREFQLPSAYLLLCLRLVFAVEGQSAV